MEEEEEEKMASKFVDAEVTTGMREKGINIMEWIDREEWRRKTTLQAQKDVRTLIYCTEIKINILKNIMTLLIKNNH